MAYGDFTRAFINQQIRNTSSKHYTSSKEKVEYPNDRGQYTFLISFSIKYIKDCKKLVYIGGTTPSVIFLPLFPFCLH